MFPSKHKFYEDIKRRKAASELYKSPQQKKIDELKAQLKASQHRGTHLSKELKEARKQINYLQDKVKHLQGDVKHLQGDAKYRQGQ